ncbi:MAG: oxaloacetate decarboxylase subunit alpha [Anaerolineae bacterium]|nr:oxaloacetate decarboxylase subunit alpha [Anaerolineae bacterium]
MKGKVNFVDLTLRDGQQSLAATRMTTQQALTVLPLIRDAGFAAVELWGGATLDSAVRFLDEDPWERLEKFRQVMGGNDKIRALLRGQNLFAYQPFPDDLVIAFIKEAITTGVGIMRIFDALNDRRNLQIALLTTKAYGGKVEAAMSYTVSPVHTTEYYVNYALQLQEDGADQIAIKDMAGLLHPNETVKLIRELKAKLTIPITLHSHTTTGLGTLNAVIAMHEGVDYIDCAITPFAGGTSHPPVEVLIVFAEEMGLAHNLNKKKILLAQHQLFNIFNELRPYIPYKEHYRPVDYKDINRHTVKKIIKLINRGGEERIEKAIDLTRELLQDLGYPEYNARILEAQIPGGMMSNLQSQLEQMGQLDKLEAIMTEIPKVRQDVGYVPLVTPTSQIVGAQATFNVMTGQRYATVSNEFTMLLEGKFGQPPAEFNPDVLKKILNGDGKQQRYRPASYLSPVLEDEYQLNFIKSHRDLLLHLMLKQSADTYLKKRYNIQ